MTLPAAAAHLAGFAGLLRAAGFPVAPEQTVAFLEAVRLLGPRSMEDIRQAASATLSPRPERHAEFETLLRAWFWGEGNAVADGESDEETRIKDDRSGPERQPAPEKHEAAGETASAAERLAVRQFASGEPAADFAGAMPRRRSFRHVRARHGGLDLRKSLRAIVRADGDIPRPALRRRPLVQRRIVLLIDISGSMKLHTQEHLKLAHAVVRHADRAEVFTLGTRLTRITAPLRIADQDRALARVAETVEDWDGGTRIGPTLLALLSVPRFAAFARGAAVVLLSDGLERGGHAEMEQAFRRLKARAFRLSLLTPLAADPRFKPRTAALRAVLPHLDDLGDGSSTASVAEFILSIARRSKTASEVWREVS
ncbi:MAG: VWA domain-containing protein [Rhizobiaceae bacterium]|nr:VWA domain-containing protein [Rhizobiaceae bacterium]